MTIESVKECTPLEMYMHVRVATPLKLNMVYHAGTQSIFVTEVNAFVLQLEAVNLNIKKRSGMLRQYIDSKLENIETLMANVCPQTKNVSFAR